ncbi:oligogalacturonate lyase family protein [Paenibacillus sp. J5C_2022]|uniref:oligogalacturonate lyase family protein n=1 Tax=Paenibacillus sp. J5C2022 TaxID=2977129 RepID=UPI0021CE747C|nr:oligogalacturonate lyase family protein [Paenibacillus sp. J5C2022]MCU6707933.1 oligogalacturonate lyase family protein [Paenibacillus sp. J5C2022]
MLAETDSPIKKSAMFTKWIDPVSGVESWILTARTAPYQSSFYFTNESMTRDGRYLWFYCAFPPSGSSHYGRLLGVADLQEDTIRHFPETAFLDASPLIDLDSGEAYWCTGLDIWRRGPEEKDEAALVHSFPEELAKRRRPARIATHLTFSADRRSLSVDAEFGEQWFCGEAPLDGSPIAIWQSFDRCYNHGQFSPTDPDLQLIAQDSWIDQNSGHQGWLDNRMWLIRRGEEARPIRADGSSGQAHEWWGADGKHVWYVDYKHGTEKVNIETGERKIVWKSGTCHSHCDRSGQYVAGDIGPYTWKDGCRVAFYNTLTSREINIVSNLPEPPLGRGRYHTDPHPQFCLNDEWICYTTTVLGAPTVALVETKHLLDQTQL